jgi:hypothetical protein
MKHVRKPLKSKGFDVSGLKFHIRGAMIYKKRPKPVPRKPKTDPWKHALTCPLPPQTSFELLDTLRQDILTYLAWVTNDLVQGDPDRAAAEIQRSADRLKTIAAMTPGALAAAIDEDLARFRSRANAERRAQLNGYIYGGIWVPPPTGLAPAGTAASFAARADRDLNGLCSN